MAIVRTIGKNTIGDNNKMKVAMHNYEMSTHDLSFVFRSSMASGVLVPCMKIIAQKGDIWDIQMTNKTLTHPTLGPLFGAYKLQHFIFTCPIRLYNSWLHNNRTGIGMKMNDIKFPIFRGGATTPGSKLNQSSLLAYLGLRGIRSSGTTTQGLNAIPLLSYIDIFKNYFANTQENNFYIVSGQTIKPESLIFKQGNVNIGIAGIPGTTTFGNVSLNSAGQVLAVTNEGTISEPVNGWAAFWQNVIVSISEKGVERTTTLRQLTSNGSSSTITLDKISTSGASIISVSITEKAMEILFPANKINLTQFPLTIMDELRDLILQTAGNTALVINKSNTGAESLTYNMIAARFQNLGGLLLKTYDSDVFQNWVKTDWIDGENGISAITAVAVQDGVITIDALNLQQKVYNMLNRIAISGGTYRDWLETVYTSGQYMERPETPVFEGGMSQIIEFEEVISKSATENQPLGDLAGRGVSSRPNGSGKLHFKVTEPSYIMGIIAITPLIDYSQGNDWDIVNLLTMNDLHKPALDGIGYEDSMNNQRAWWTRDLATGKDTSAGKTVAWINYMTNFNKSFGNFASGNSESFMCLNRNYERNSTDNSIADLTTYIDPAKHNEIFADTDRGAQNFWVQTAFDIKVRRNISAKQIPNI
jgi:hypothetical protein